MNKKETILNNDQIAYYSGFGGIEIHHIQHSINDYIYYTSGAWNGPKKYHRKKIQYNTEGNAYFLHNNFRIYLNECIRWGL